MKTRTKILNTLAAAAMGTAMLWASPALAEDTIKVGVLHSLSGTMAISETTLKDAMLMLIEEQNKKGGVLGKKLEAVVVEVLNLEIVQIYHRIIENSRIGRWERKMLRGLGND